MKQNHEKRMSPTFCGGGLIRSRLSEKHPKKELLASIKSFKVEKDLRLCDD